MFLIKSEVTQVIISKRSFLFMFFSHTFKFYLNVWIPKFYSTLQVEQQHQCEKSDASKLCLRTFARFSLGGGGNGAGVLKLYLETCARNSRQYDNMLQTFRSCNSTTLTLLGHFFCGAKKNGLQRSGKMFWSLIWNFMKIWKEQLLEKFHEISEFHFPVNWTDVSTCPLVPPVPEG